MHSLQEIKFANSEAARAARNHALKARIRNTIEAFKERGRLATEPYRGPVFGHEAAPVAVEGGAK
jgi:hypothetical protein